MVKQTATNGMNGVALNVQAWAGDVPEVATDEWAAWVQSVTVAAEMAHDTLVEQYPSNDTFDTTIGNLIALGRTNVDGVRKAVAEAIKCIRLAQASVDVVRPVAAIVAASRLASDATNLRYYGPGGSGVDTSYGSRYFTDSFARIQAACLPVDGAK